jgi:small subunit ribosomal protein S2
VIPGNDDAIKSIRLFTASLADAATEGLHMGRNEAAGQGGGVEVIRRAAYVDEAATEGREDEN